MNTRAKIVSDIVNPARPVLLVTGLFEILRVEMVRELSGARQRTGAKSVVAVVLSQAEERMPLARRAEMAAALRVIDYVIISGAGEWESLAARLQPVEIIHLEEADALRTRELIEHVRRCQAR